jgi:carbon monoxide dehydrogenase subunit G
MIKAAIPVDAPKEQVFAVLSTYAEYQKWLPGCESSKLTSSSGNISEAEIVINTMKRMMLGLRFEAVGTQLLNFKMVKGTDMKAYSGSYKMMDAADGKGTVVVAELEIDAGPMAPRFIVDRMAKKAIDDTGTALRKYIKTLPPPTASATAESPKSAPKARKVIRARRILRVTKRGETQAIWYLGKTFAAS